MNALLLDSHTLLWTFYERDKLSRRASEAISDPSKNLFVSLASLWELANKAAAKRLPLVGDNILGLIRRCEEYGVAVLPITIDDVLASAKLPFHHADPFDRILIAQAQQHGMVLVSRDSKARSYDVQQLW